MKIFSRYALSFGFVFLLTAHTFGDQGENANPCPMALLDAILSQQEGVVATLLYYGADPNASLENCAFPIAKPSFLWDWFGTDYYDLTEQSTLLHAAALVSVHHPSIYSGIEDRADENTINALDHRNRTASNIVDDKAAIFAASKALR